MAAVSNKEQASWAPDLVHGAIDFDVHVVANLIVAQRSAARSRNRAAEATKNTCAYLDEAACSRNVKGAVRLHHHGWQWQPVWHPEWEHQGDTAQVPSGPA
ncbi:hypothetical protein HaLaN_21191 [Haematococcus lacustris]|uniref:Uncharacterized protein n=1 Tax=Haematococcus lacustris TaxID=44745 RepID=A0A699ZLM7_HAELA|nr:hypothetical protein HaLaN_21191 [Haematococcus lacustris]